MASAPKKIPKPDTKGTVSRRALFFIGGYDPKSPEAFFDRLDRESGRYETLTGREVDALDRETIGDHLTLQRYAARSDPDGTDIGAVETDFHFVNLDSIVLHDFEAPFLVRLKRYGVTFFDYMASGTAFAFIRHAWRFSLYFFYPAMMILLSFVVSLALAMLIARSGVSLAWLTAPVIFLAAFSAFVQMVWKRRFVLHLMDLWSFSRDFIHRSREDIEIKLESVAQAVVRAAKSKRYDEIILVGHSTGGALILNTAARALRADDGLTAHGSEVTLLTVGSTALKIGLHPAAQWFRDEVKSITADENFHWAEYQCRTDLINFFNTQPAHLMGDTSANKPTVLPIRVSRMISPEAYKRVRKNFFRVHYQFVFGNTRPYHYDFPDICFGHIFLSARAEYTAAQIKAHKQAKIT
ncbi:MAG: lipase [Pseudomonadota bacterium]